MLFCSLTPYTTGLRPDLNLEEMTLSGHNSKFLKTGTKVTVKNFSFEGVSV